jgi:hypothetical protein
MGFEVIVSLGDSFGYKLFDSFWITESIVGRQDRVLFI